MPAGHSTPVRTRLRSLGMGNSCTFAVPPGVATRQFLIACSAVAGQVLGSGRYRARTTSQGIEVQHLPSGETSARARRA